MKGAVYQIRNLINDKIYVGSSGDVEKRKREHFNSLKKNKHYSLFLQRSWNKYGERNFVFEILEEVKSVKDLIDREQYWIDKTNCFKKEYGYNSRKKAESNLGLLMSEEQKKKISLTRKKNKVAEGEKNPNVKLSQKKVAEIRLLYKSENYKQVELAKLFCVKRAQINKILQNKVWRDENYEGIVARENTKGENSSSAKLTWEKVAKIRELYGTGKYFYKGLAEEYGVSYTAIEFIINNRNWKRKSDEQQK
jgi:group I intron endonuclease